MPTTASFGMRSFLAAILLLAIAAPSEAATIEGRARVIDGDTLEIQGERIRLHGIDAPETAQTCRRPSGKEWQCGQEAALALPYRLVEMRQASRAPPAQAPPP